jgi:hypothetical protein
MTSEELRAAEERVRSVDGIRNLIVADHLAAWTLARAWLAEHKPDDEFPLEWEWLAAVATMHKDEGYWDVPPDDDVWWEIGPLSFSCDSYQSDPGDPTENVPIDWQVDGDTLPQMLVPTTRGKLRRLCALLGHPLADK